MPLLRLPQITLEPRGQGEEIGRKRVQRLMREMGLQAICPKPNTSKPHPGHKIYPYLLRDVPIERADQVWSTDITHIPMGENHVHLRTVMDWRSR